MAALGLALILLGGPGASAQTISLLGSSETSPPPGYLRIEQDNAAVSYSGNWTTQASTAGCSYSGGTAVNATASSAQASFNFTGTAVRWVGYQDASSGIADIYLDGVFQTSVDTYSLTPVCQAMIFAASGLASGPHTLTIITTGTKSLASFGTSVWVDAFDYQPQPSVDLTEPADGATVSGTVTVSANASDDSGGSITSVQFKLDGANLGTAVTAAPYQVSWDTTAATNGSHTLTAVATDSSGNSTTATPVTVTVSNGSTGGKPTVTMTAPADGATVSGSVTVSASASDSGGSLTSVQFKLDGANLGAAVTAAPYQVSWNTDSVANGSHTLTAVATDSGGSSASASPVTVTVSNTTRRPTVTMTAPANGATLSGSVTVSANASESGGNVASVQFTLDGANLSTAMTAAPYQVSWNSSAAANGSHTLGAVATDSSGNTAAATPVTVTVNNGSTTTRRIQENDPAVAYTGNWLVISDPSVSGGNAVEANAANATATLSFTGTAVTWISYRCACTAGISEVSVDDGSPTQVDTNATTTQAQAPVFTASGLKQGPHTLKITVTGQYDRAGNSAYVVVDAFDITSDAQPQSDPAPTPPPPPDKGGRGSFGLPLLGLLFTVALVRRRSKERGHTLD